MTTIHPYAYYDRSKQKWTFEDTQQLRSAYEEDMLDILECANLLKRTPGCISYKLKSMGIISHNVLARGYSEYKASPLYAEVVETHKKEEEQGIPKRPMRLQHSSGAPYTPINSMHPIHPMQPILSAVAATPTPPTVAEELDAKEAHLRAQVEYYKANIDQLVRIKALEAELEHLKGVVLEKYAKQAETDRMMRDVILPCRDHIQKIMPSIITLWMYGNRQQKQTDWIPMPKLPSGMVAGRVAYSFEPIADTTSITCSAIGSHINQHLSGIWNGHELVFNTP